MAHAVCAGIEKRNDLLVAQLEKEPGSRGLVLISPDSSPEAVSARLDVPQVAGFKPYHLFSREEPTFEAPISSYLPEWAWEIAHQHGAVITLHIVRRGALRVMLHRG